MKLYLATSSLNVDNILSTESVAPLSFYKKRDYGYNSFASLELIPYKNVLILFSKIPGFEINDSEHDSRPVILEISVNEESDHLKYLGDIEGIKLYSTDTIIRLSPLNTRLLFYNYKDLNISKLSCSDSLTNKLGDLFHFDTCNADFNLVSFLQFDLHVDDTCNDYNLKVAQDNRLNAIKGFVFGYYLGVSKSVSLHTAILLRTQKRIYDIVSTIKNNGSLGNKLFYEELDQLDKEYRMNDPSTIKCKELWYETLKEYAIPAESLDKLLEIYDEKSVVKNSFMKKNGLEPSVSLRQYGYTNLEMYRDNLIFHTSSIIKEDQQEQLSMFAVDSTFDLDPSYETCMLAGEDSDSMLFNKFLDAILWQGVAPTPESLRIDRFNIATQITISAKSIWESLNWKWQDSSVQIFMNELRQNIKNFTPFDVNKENNIIIKSIAAFVLKGEDYDYRYVLALWGATQGYVKMSKPIISALTKSSSFGKIFKAIFSLLYNIECDGELSYNQKSAEIKRVTQDELLFSSVSSEKGDKVREWQNGIRSYLDQLKNVPKKKDLYAPLESAFIENGDQMDYAKFFTLLNDYKEWKNSKGEPIKAWKAMVEYFCPDDYASRFGDNFENNNGTTRKQNIVQKTLNFFGLSEKNEEGEKKDDPTHQGDSRTKTYYKSSSFISDKHCWDFIKTLVPENLHKEVNKDLKWFQEEYEKGDKSQYYARASRENQATIDAFIRYLAKKKYASSLNIQSIGNYLRRIYVR